MVDENITFRLKPMNCPSHMTLYKEMGLHSYRELPLRFCEFATLYRYEKTGELSGLTRVRSLTQDEVSPLRIWQLHLREKAPVLYWLMRTSGSRLSTSYLAWTTKSASQTC